MICFHIGITLSLTQYCELRLADTWIKQIVSCHALPGPKHELKCIEMLLGHEGRGAMYQAPRAVASVVAVAAVALAVLCLSYWKYVNL